MFFVSLIANTQIYTHYVYKFLILFFFFNQHTFYADSKMQFVFGGHT